MMKKYLSFALALLLMLVFTTGARATDIYNDGEIVIDSTNLYPVTDGGLTLGKSGNEFAGLYVDSVTLGGVAKTSWGSVISPITDGTGYVNPTDAGAYVRLYDAGYLRLGDATNAGDYYTLYTADTDAWYAGHMDTTNDYSIGYGSTPDADLRLCIVDDANETRVVLGDAANNYDTVLVFDGYAQDYYIALDDSADDLLIGLGNVVATTPILSADENQAIVTYGNITMTGTTPALNIGDAGAEDTQVNFLGNAQNFHIGLEDATDDLHIGLGTTLGTTPAISITDGLAITTYADITMTGATPTLTVGDGGNEDNAVVFDGTIDFSIGVDSTASLFEITNGTDLDQTTAFSIADTTLAALLAGDLTIEGGDITVPSATASKPVLWLENQADDATCPTIRMENDRATETDGDDLGRISFYGSDDGDAASEFVYILAEANEIDATDEAGKLSIGMEINDSATVFLQMFGDTTDVDTGHIEFNSGTVDIDFHIDSSDQADLFLLDGATNDITLTRNLAAGATTDGPILVVTNTSATGDVGVASFLNAAGASATAPTVTIQSSAAGVVKSSLLVNHDGTAGATTESAVRIDSEDVNTAALYITSPVTQAGTSDVFDETALAVVAEGVGGAASLYRNVASATNSVLLVKDDHADSTGPLATFTYDGDDTADDVAVTIEATAAAYDKDVLAIVNAGAAGAVFIDQNLATGTTLEPALEVDSQNVDTAAVIIRSPVDATGTDPDFDDYAVGISVEGIGGGLHVHRDVASCTSALVMIEDDHIDGTGPALLVQSDQDATGDDNVVQINVTSTACDTAALQITQAGTYALLLSDGGVTLSVEDLTCSGADPGVAAATATTVISTVVTDTTGDAADEVALANGVKGDIKIFTLKTDGEATGLKIIPATFASGTYILLEDVGDGCILVFDGTSWVLVANNGGTVG